MFSNIQVRFFSLNRIAFNTVEKSSLVALRKKTGYSFIHIKKALLLNENDLEKAETWLRKQAQVEGWAKVQQVKNRIAANGVIGVHHDHSSASIVEIKCETDFVARTFEFKKLASEVAKACSAFASQKSLESPISKWNLTTEQLNNIISPDGKKLQDLVALSVGELKENVILNRGLCVKVDDQFKVSGYAHPAQKVDEDCPSNFVGQYGAVLIYKSNESSPNQERQAAVVQQVCQHVVGLNPKEIGSLEEWQKAYELKKQAEIEAQKEAVDEVEEEKPIEPYENEDGDLIDASDLPEKVQTFDEDEERLLYQGFILNPDMSVGEVATNSGVEIVEFTRFQCGEKVEPTLDNISRLE